MEVEICDYKLSLKLKGVGYNEWCRQYWCTAIRHDGKDLYEDEEYELKSEGKDKEIEYIPGGWVHEHWNRNNDDIFGDDVCSAPLINDVIDWLEKHKNIFIVPELTYGIESHGVFYYKWKTIVYRFTETEGMQWHTVTGQHSNKYEALSEAIEYALDNLIEKVI